MSHLAEKVARAICRDSPDAICFSCLAAQHGVSEHHVRGVALVLITRNDWQLVRRSCSRCQRTDEVLLAHQAA